MRRRVVITGMGAITPLGHSVEALYRGQTEGKSGVGPITLFNASRFPTKIAAQLKDFDLGKFVGNTERWGNAGSNSRFAAAASQQALADAELLENDKVDRTRFGIYLGCGEGIQDFHHLISLVAQCSPPQGRTVDPVAFSKGGLKFFHPGRESEQELHTPPAHLASHFNLQGPNYNCLTACAASSQAIGEATDLIRRGDADLMLSGGSHSMIHPLGVTGFNLLTALSTGFNNEPTRASRPFDARRDGFVLGEGAGMLVLEELEHAKKRKAHIYAELTGYGSTADAFRVTDSHHEGRGAIACIAAALRDAALPPSE